MSVKTAIRRPAKARATSRGEQTREAILTHALGLATRIGFEGLTIGRLAEDLQMSKSGLFAHFRSKEALQLEILRMAGARMVDSVVKPALAAPRGEARVRALFDRWLAWEQSPGLPGGCPFMAASFELDARPGARLRRPEPARLDGHARRRRSHRGPGRSFPRRPRLRAVRARLSGDRPGVRPRLAPDARPEGPRPRGQRVRDIAVRLPRQAPLNPGKENTRDRRRIHRDAEKHDRSLFSNFSLDAPRSGGQPCAVAPGARARGARRRASVPDAAPATPAADGDRSARHRARAADARRRAPGRDVGVGGRAERPPRARLGRAWRAARRLRGAAG